MTRLLNKRWWRDCPESSGLLFWSVGINPVPDIDPKKVAERLAGGGTLKQEQVTLPNSVWTVSSANRIDCPHCGEESKHAFASQVGDVVNCKNCNKEIRILDKEVREVEDISIPEEVLRKLMASMDHRPMSIGSKIHRHGRDRELGNK